jgi:hypothetical protein
MIDLRLAVTDQTVGDQPVKIRCKEHNDKVNSLAVYANGLRCFGCGFTLQLRDKDGRDLTTLPGHRDPLAYLLGKEQISPEEAAKYTSEALDRYREKAAQEARMDPLPRSYATIYNDVLNGAERCHRLQWFLDRGLSLETINHPDVLLGHNGLDFIIPIFDEGRRLVSMRYRMDPEYRSEADVAKHKYMGMRGRNGLYLYPEPLLANAAAGNATVHPSRLYVCEGELDALRIWEWGAAAVSCTNGAGQVEKIPALIKEHYPNFTHLVIATDQDEPGEEAAQRTIKVAEGLGFTTERWHWDGAKDVTEYLQRAA